jgi:FkbM family methyltransferase
MPRAAVIGAVRAIAAAIVAVYRRCGDEAIALKRVDSRCARDRADPMVTSLIVLACIASLACITACGQETNTEEQPVEPSSTSQSDSRQRTFETVIADKLREHESAEGREGILAEERLYSNFDEELIIRDFFEDRRDGFYVDIGCSFAVKGSNTYYLEERLGWTGIGVDALEEYALEWAQLRPRSRFLRHLVSDRSGGTEKFFKSYGRAISSTDPNWAAGKAFGQNFPTEEIQAETITLDDLLNREKVTKIDLLSMDIEGHEQKALAGFDIERFQPTLVVIERQVTPPKQRAIESYFARHGYQRIEKYRKFDTINDYYRRKTP